jgi:hypothetical protein
MALVGAVTEADHPVGAALDVIGDLRERLGGDLRDARIARTRERREQQAMPGVEIELARHGVGVVAIGLLDEQQIAKLPALAQERQRVLAATGAGKARLDLARVGKPQPCLAEKI